MFNIGMITKSIKLCLASHQRSLPQVSSFCRLLKRLVDRQYSRGRSVESTFDVKGVGSAENWRSVPASPNSNPPVKEHRLGTLPQT
jgi:hypothetical protein